MQQKMFRSQVKELKLKIRSLDIIGSTKKKGMYAVSSPRAIIKIKRRVKMTALLDIKANINVITIKIADVTNLPILEITPMETETFTDYNTQLVGICREVNI
jgi:hypothetical protein